ncbi:hypothetical protein LSTR_LSTR002859 [Laodelphax striatellus]|uniref:Uncharacterized protein n=1 Tax=Laodelphax striatellus TaxID=195883 RepID=A0A482XHM6_LAOST|nr:hypothetical protein LSTR_LSTR002859 [Laodelphax striatellus]
MLRERSKRVILGIPYMIMFSRTVALKSRHSFMARTTALTGSKEECRLNRWRDELNGDQPDPLEGIRAGHNLDYTVWRTLNRMRSGVSRCKSNLLKWAFFLMGMIDVNVEQGRIKSIC